MIKEIRIPIEAILDYPIERYNVMHLLQSKGFPCDDSTLTPRPKAGLVYYELHDHKTGEIVVRWEED